MLIRKSFNFFVFCVFASGVVFASEPLEQERRWIVELKESIERQDLSVFKGCIGIENNQLIPFGVNFAKKEAQVNSACVFPLTAALKTKLLSSNYPLLFIQDSWADKDVEDKNKAYYFQLNDEKEVKAFQEKLRAIDLRGRIRAIDLRERKNEKRKSLPRGFIINDCKKLVSSVIGSGGTDKKFEKEAVVGLGQGQKVEEPGVVIQDDIEDTGKEVEKKGDEQQVSAKRESKNSLNITFDEGLSAVSHMVQLIKNEKGELRLIFLKHGQEEARFNPGDTKKSELQKAVQQSILQKKRVILTGENIKDFYGVGLLLINKAMCEMLNVEQMFNNMTFTMFQEKQNINIAKVSTFRNEYTNEDKLAIVIHNEKKETITAIGLFPQQLNCLKTIVQHMVPSSFIVVEGTTSSGIAYKNLLTIDEAGLKLLGLQQEDDKKNPVKEKQQDDKDVQNEQKNDPYKKLAEELTESIQNIEKDLPGDKKLLPKTSFWTPKKVVATSVTLCGLAFFAFMQYKNLSVAGILPFLKTLLVIKFAK